MARANFGPASDKNMWGSSRGPKQKKTVSAWPGPHGFCAKSLVFRAPVTTGRGHHFRGETPVPGKEVSRGPALPCQWRSSRPKHERSARGQPPLRPVQCSRIRFPSTTGPARAGPVHRRLCTSISHPASLAEIGIRLAVQCAELQRLPGKCFLGAARDVATPTRKANEG